MKRMLIFFIFIANVFIGKENQLKFTMNLSDSQHFLLINSENGEILESSKGAKDFLWI